jgi:hypothetical protein
MQNLMHGGGDDAAFAVSAAADSEALELRHARAALELCERAGEVGAEAVDAGECSAARRRDVHGNVLHSVLRLLAAR